MGSSPHTRGAPSSPTRPRFRMGIIPAYAGSTPPDDGGAGGDGDHPRIRGEHCPSVSQSPTRRGSSPHTRGAPGIHALMAPRRRIIPAYAGSTSWASKPAKPRIGSSPHTRGAPAAINGRSGRCRIIPAYAGSTFSRIFPALPKADHPRIRGEHLKPDYVDLVRVGSSPHTRGARAGRG